MNLKEMFINLMQGSRSYDNLNNCWVFFCLKAEEMEAIDLFG